MVVSLMHPTCPGPIMIIYYSNKFLTRYVCISFSFLCINHFTDLYISIIIMLIFMTLCKMCYVVGI